MQRFFRIPVGLAMVAISLGGLASCKKRGETLKSDLGEAGYQLTEAEWFRASRENDAAALKKFIAAGFKPDLRNPDGDSALHVAASAGAHTSADFLLSRALPVDLRGAAGRTPLMAAVMADQTGMVGWLLRQGADPRLKDQDGFMPLMLAVREGSGGAVGELAPYNREDLDAALLLAALVGRAEVIDSLTNYGASVYARMEDGRTPLMIAAENGHQAAVELLLDIGAGRYAVDPEGRSAVDLAQAAGHPEIATMISREPAASELTLESPEQVASAMDLFVDTAIAKSFSDPSLAENATVTDVSSADGARLDVPAGPAMQRGASEPLAGQVLSRPMPSPQPARQMPSVAPPFPLPPLVMRHYRERQVPVQVQSVQGGTATVTLPGAAAREVKVRVGETIPGSRLEVVRVRRRMEDSKLSAGRLMEVSVVDVRDTSTGTTREWISGLSANAHDPVALVEDAATGKRYVASPGQRFKATDGTEYIVSDVRPNQMIIEEAATGAVRTIPLRGPRG
jgi:ankyrin repeat protein